MTEDKNNFKNFLKKHWITFVILSLLPVCAIVVFVLLMLNNICGISDFGSMLGGVLAYLGTTMLGSVTIWQVERQRSENFELIKQQNFELNKGNIQIFIEVLYNDVIFVVKNTGKSEICKGAIKFEKDWLDALHKYGDIADSFTELLQKSLTKNLYLAANQEIRFFLYQIGLSKDYYNFLLENECKAFVSYQTMEQEMSYVLTINFHSTLSSYYGESLKEKSIDKLDKALTLQNKEISAISNELKNVNAQLLKISNPTSPSTKTKSKK